MNIDGFETMPVLETRPLFSMRLAVGGARMVGGPAGAGRRVFPIPGGRFAGKRLRGKILADGSDWQIERGDDAILLDGRIVMETHDDALIAMIYTGLRYGPAKVMERLQRGEDVDPTSYYFRIVPRFETSDVRYEWLNRVVAIGVGHRLPDGPVYFVHEIA